MNIFIYFRELAAVIHYDQLIELRSWEHPDELLLSAPIKLREIKLEEYLSIAYFPVRRIIPQDDKLVIYLEDEE